MKRRENWSDKFSNNFPLPPRHVRQQNSAGFNGGLSAGSSMRRPRSEDPHRHQRNLVNCQNNFHKMSNFQIVCFAKAGLWLTCHSSTNIFLRDFIFQMFMLKTLFDFQLNGRVVFVWLVLRANWFWLIGSYISYMAG